MNCNTTTKPMETKKQTAVETFNEEVNKHILDLFNREIDADGFELSMANSYSKALEMEQIQMTKPKNSKKK